MLKKVENKRTSLSVKIAGRGIKMNRTISLLLVGTVWLVACGGANGKGQAGTGPSTDETIRLGNIGDQTQCDAKGGREMLIDLNQDGKPDVRKIYKKIGTEEIVVCREADLNFDGIKDIYIFFDDTGQVTRDEVDLDYDGKIDIISTYVKGKVIKQEIDTNADSKVDRVRHLQDDLPIRVEGDTDGDGKVDYWEYYEAGKLVRIGIDEDGDGRADNWSRDEATSKVAASSPEGEEEESEKEEEGETDKDEAVESESTPEES